MARLREHEHQAYLVGGAVRDLLLGGHPKDFDVATDATPEEVHALFRNSRIIGQIYADTLQDGSWSEEEIMEEEDESTAGSNMFLFTKDDPKKVDAPKQRRGKRVKQPSKLTVNDLPVAFFPSNPL